MDKSAPAMVSAFVAGIVVFFAVWSALSLSAVAIHAGVTVAGYAMMPALVAGGMAGIAEYRYRPSGMQVRWMAPSRIGIGGALLLALLPVAGSWLMPMWAMAVGLLLAVSIRGERTFTVAAYGVEEHSRWDGPILIAAAIAAIALTLLSNRPQVEDYRYLWSIVRLLHHPDQPMFDLMTIYPGRQEIYAWHPREILVAVLQRQTGISLLALYYYVLPVLHAAMTVAVLYVSARQFGSRDAAPVTAVCILVLTAWGQTHASPGNFSFARMFHGQAVLASWAGPVAFWYGVRFGHTPTLRHGGLVLAAILCAFGQWHSGAVVGPVAALTGILAAWRSEKPWFTPVLVAGLPLLIGGGFVAAALLFPSAHLLLPVRETAAEALGEVFPADIRSIVALMTIGGAGLFLSGAASRLAMRALLFGLVLVLNPWGMELLSRIITSLSFRVLWAFPFALFVGLGVVGAIRLEVQHWRLPILSLGVAAVFLLSGTWITAVTNGNSFGDTGYKVFPDLREWVERGDETPLFPGGNLIRE